MTPEIQKEHLISVEEKVEKKLGIEISDTELDAAIDLRFQKLSEFALSQDSTMVKCFYQACLETANEYGLTPDDLLLNVYEYYGKDRSEIKSNLEFFGLSQSAFREGIDPVVNSALSICKAYGMDKMTFIGMSGRLEGDDLYTYEALRLQGKDLVVLQTPEAKILYDSLVTEWKLQKVDLNSFINLLRFGDKVSFFSSKGNAEKVRTVIEMYGLKFKNMNYQLASRDFDELYKLVNFVGVFEMIPERFERIAGAGKIDLVRKYFSKDTDFDFIDMSVLLDVKLLDDSETLEKTAGFLRIEYGMQDEDLRNFFNKFEQYSAADLYNLVNDPVAKDLFVLFSEKLLKDKKLTVLGRSEKMDVGDFFKVIGEIKDIPDVQLVVVNMAKIGFDLSSRGNVEFIKKDIARWQELFELVKRDDFVDFVVKYYEKYPEQKNNYNLVEMGKLFERGLREPDVLEVVFSENYEKVLVLVKTDFPDVPFEFLNFSLLAKICKKFDKFKTVYDFLRESGERISTTDFSLILEFSVDLELLELLKNRTFLEEKIMSDIYSLPFVNRDYSGEKNGPQTERPDLKSIPSLHLLRIYLIGSGLENADFALIMGKTIAEDLNNKGTEIGGSIVLNGDRSVSIEKDNTFHGENTAFNPADSPYFPEGLSDFHNHMVLEVGDLIKYERLRSPTIKDTLVPSLQKNGYLDEKGLLDKWDDEELSQIVSDLLHDSTDVEGDKKIVMGVLRNSYMLDNSKYAGPSGVIGSFGDFGRVSQLGSSGVVFTAVGFYTDEAGNVDRTKLKVNADFYFADGEGVGGGEGGGSGKKKPVVVDLGVMVVDV